MSDIKIGFVAGGDLDKVSAMEQLPIDSLWTGGHIASRNPSPEALMSLARLSAVTERVTIGTSILLLPLYEPAIVAKQMTDLDRATGGRVVLGVGVGGEYPAEFRACHVPVNERGRRTDEAIELLRKLWTAEEISHDGRFYAFEDVRIHPAPLQPGGPPIVVAGRKEPAMRRAARLGDGWMPYLYSARRYAASVETIQEYASDAGRDLDDFGWYAWVFVNVHADGDRAREGAARTMGGSYDQDFREMVDNVAVAGTPDEVTDKLVAFVDAGARHFIFMPAAGPDGDADAIVHGLLDDVVPRVARAHDVGVTVNELLGLDGQPALVVGGGYGSGRVTAILLARAGARVVVADIDGDRAETVAAEIGGHAIAADVTTEAGAAAAVDEAHDVLGGLTRLANIVGLVDMRPFADTNAAQWDAQLRLNLYSQLLVCHAAGRHMLADGRGGAIAMVASVSGFYGARNHVAYGIAKAGVMSLARTLADEWGPQGIRVNCVAPDITAVPRLIDQLPMPGDEAFATLDAMAVAEGVPLRRFGRTEEIAGPLLFLLSDLSSFMTGQTLVVDGGTMVHFPHRTAADDVDGG